MSKKLMDNDERVDAILEYLWQTWNIKTLAIEINNQFPNDDEKLVRKVAAKIANAHCSGKHYDQSYFIKQLEKLL